ncbi:MAG: ABC transporter ATP-binding protein [Chloroflexota bacterium]|nr:MAG: ABC transporter ATP-binding protein [Chloroflexota bacterium]
MIRLDRVDKVYAQGKRQIVALKDISLTIQSGEFVAIMGASGSGKSTLLHLIGGLDLPSSGEVWLGNRCTSKMSDRDLTVLRRREIGLVFQFFNLLPTLTAEENITLPLRLAGVSPASANGRVEELLRLVGLQDRRRHRPEELSGGQMQRVAIARALVANPPLLLADEPTGNLDSRTGEEILLLLKQTVELYGHTIVMVTHDPKAAAYGDRIITLKDGAIVEQIWVREGHDSATSSR